MFKTLINTVVLFLLFLGNLALFTWCVNRIEWDQSHVEKTLISNVQAEGTPQVLMISSVARDKVAVPKVVFNHATSLTTPPQLSSHSNSQLVIRFKGGDLQLQEADRARLESMLQRLEIGTSHAVEVLAADTVVAEKKMGAAQFAKLRAQNVARVIYPHTQTVKMLYRPSLEEDTVIVDFSPSRVK